jgi:hypothetical protein
MSFELDLKERSFATTVLFIKLICAGIRVDEMGANHSDAVTNINALNETRNMLLEANDDIKSAMRAASRQWLQSDDDLKLWKRT